MPLLIKNGEIITVSERTVADIYCEEDQITRIERNLQAPPGTEIIDATGKYVFPGFIDPHVHIYLPFMGTFAKDTHTTGSQAALIGGTTSFIEMCVPARAEEPLEAFETWNGKATGHSACDWTFHVGVTRWDDEVASQLKEVINTGIASFKIFLAYKGAFGVTDYELYNTLKFAKEHGIITTAHCENPTAIEERQKEFISAGKTGTEWHERSRPVSVEAHGVHHLCTYAELHDAHVYVVHTSCEAALNVAHAARSRGVKAWVETVIPYLILDSSYAELPDFEGAKYVMSPPIRNKRNQAALWNGLRNGLISTVGTDHAPFDFEGQKPMGRGDFTKIPNGVPSLEERVKLLYSHGVKEGRIDIHQFVDTASTQVAKIFGLFPRKGTIQVGSDADLVIWDDDYRGTVSATTHHMNVDYNGFEGCKVEGRPDIVTVRGQVAVRGGEFVGDPARGKFIKREPSHF
jgi:dihydropyrimidinase